MATATPVYQPAPPPSRPLGVAILAVLIGIYGFIEFLIGLFLVVGATVFSSFSKSFTEFGLTGVELGAVIAVLGLIILGLAVGLWHLRMWALVLMLIFLAFELVLNGLAGAYISFGFIVALLLFIYLLAVNRHFR
jgi:hypothetical protein